jgi:hypothetical protein
MNNTDQKAYVKLDFTQIAWVVKDVEIFLYTKTSNMEKLLKKFKIGVSTDIAFEKFLNELNEWWPKEYTWSQDGLEEIRIEGKKDGLCTEIGPFGFRCDWGRVTELTENKSIGLKWQIGPKREPVPDPRKASDIKVSFIKSDNLTNFIFEHFNFENHGEGWQDYGKMMDSELGWDYILNSFKQYCEKGSIAWK